VELRDDGCDSLLLVKSDYLFLQAGDDVDNWVYSELASYNSSTKEITYLVSGRLHRDLLVQLRLQREPQRKKGWMRTAWRRIVDARAGR